MELPGIFKKIHQKIEDDQHWLTHRKLLVFGATLIIAGLLIGLFENSSEEPQEVGPAVIDLTIPERLSLIHISEPTRL